MAGASLVARIPDGNRVIAEMENGHQNLAYIVHSDALDRPILRTQGDESAYFHWMADGSVSFLTEDGGDVIERCHYSAYGETTVENNHGAGCTQHRYQHQGVEVGNSYGYQGQMYHAATGLYSMRARWYAPERGRFLTPDPIGLNGGQNRYQFVAASPILFRDPFGLDPKAAGDDASRGKMGLLDLLMPWHQIGVRRGGSSLAEQLDISRAQRVNQFTRSMAGATIVGSATAVPTIVGASYLAPAAAESAWVGLGGPTILRFLDDGWNRGWVNSLWFNAQNLTNQFLVPAYEGATFGFPGSVGLPMSFMVREAETLAVEGALGGDESSATSLTRLEQAVLLVWRLMGWRLGNK